MRSIVLKFFPLPVGSSVSCCGELERHNDSFNGWIQTKNLRLVVVSVHLMTMVMIPRIYLVHPSPLEYFFDYFFVVLPFPCLSLFLQLLNHFRFIPSRNLSHQQVWLKLHSSAKLSILGSYGQLTFRWNILYYYTSLLNFFIVLYFHLKRYYIEAICIVYLSSNLTCSYCVSLQ